MLCLAFWKSDITRGPAFLFAKSEPSINALPPTIYLCLTLERRREPHIVCPPHTPLSTAMSSFLFSCVILVSTQQTSHMTKLSSWSQGSYSSYSFIGWLHLGGIFQELMTHLLHWHFRNSKSATAPEILKQIRASEENALGMHNSKS